MKTKEGKHKGKDQMEAESYQKTKDKIVLRIPHIKKSP